MDYRNLKKLNNDMKSLAPGQINPLQWYRIGLRGSSAEKRHGGPGAVVH